ncbi:DUF3678 domain-containing protein [Pseudolysobacter antarcticus]|uniref:DUF3678 domain-containing protein n=1 Tax=Pseudolysobacter antarcticus TaxID=2511995 RepID=A0A411HLF4_9GAMM|nr:DUF3678 domain-containing protein [Pseudolysobacter antarcticus]
MIGATALSTSSCKCNHHRFRRIFGCNKMSCALILRFA